MSWSAGTKLVLVLRLRLGLWIRVPVLKLVTMVQNFNLEKFEDWKNTKKIDGVVYFHVASTYKLPVYIHSL